MTKVEALKILIQNSVVLSNKTKGRFLAKLNAMSQEEVDVWGKTLSREQDLIEKFSKE